MPTQNSMKRRQQKILALVHHYQVRMGLERWELHVAFAACRATAACSADDEYLYAELVFDLARMTDPAYDADVVRHELLHCLTWELVRVGDLLAGKDKHARELVRAANERCTTLLERMPVWRKR